MIIISCKSENNQSPNTSNSVSISVTQDNEKKKTILFFGNSLTAGYQLEEQYSFPSLIEDRIDSLGLPYDVVNAGLSGETTSGGKERIDWVLKQPVDIFVLELGANDVFRGQDVRIAEKNLSDILEKVKNKNPNVKFVIAGMLAPPNMGSTYTKQFEAMYPNLAKKYNAKLIPFLLENVAMKPELNLPDGKHPNIEGQKIVKENVWKVLKNIL